MQQQTPMTVEKAIEILEGLAKCLPAAKSDFDAIVKLLEEKKGE